MKNCYGTPTFSVQDSIIWDRKERAVTMYFAIFGLECRSVSESCGQRTGQVYSIKSSGKLNARRVMPSITQLEVF